MPPAGQPHPILQDDIADFLAKCRIEGGNRGITIMEDDRGRWGLLADYCCHHCHDDHHPFKHHYDHHHHYDHSDHHTRAAGDAYVELETADDLDDAMRMHKRDMGSRLLSPRSTSPPLTSPHLTPPHPTSLHPTSPHP